MKLVLKFFLLFLVGLVAYDAVQDAASGCVFDPPGAVVCHACSCGPHLAPDMQAAVPVPVTPPSFSAYRPSRVVSPPPDSIFRPPNASA